MKILKLITAFAIALGLMVALASAYNLGKLHGGIEALSTYRPEPHP